jgi:hypothetical protein
MRSSLGNRRWTVIGSTDPKSQARASTTRLAQRDADPKEAEENTGARLVNEEDREQSTVWPIAVWPRTACHSICRLLRDGSRRLFAVGQRKQ